MSEPCIFIKKETLVQVFFCEFFQIFKNTFFVEHVWETASAVFEISLQYLISFQSPLKLIIQNFYLN